MKTVLTVTATVVLLVIACPLVYLYWRYRNTPARIWYSQLRIRRDALLARREVLKRGPVVPTNRLRELRDNLFAEHLESVSVVKLDRFPGIGMGMIQKLQESGFNSLWDLQGRNFQEISGIGPKKDQDLRDARTQLIRENEALFEAGGCPLGQQYRAEQASQRSAYEAECQRFSLELASVETALAECDRLERLHGNISFINYVLSKPHSIPDEVLNAPLPEAIIAAPAPPPVVIPQAPTPSPGFAPALARNGPSAVILPPRLTERQAPQPKDLFEDQLSKTSAPSSSSSATASPPPAVPQMLALARFGFLIARADGRIAQAERKAIRSYLEQKFGSDPRLVGHIDVSMETAEKSIPSESDAVTGILGAVPETGRAEVFAWAERIADASGDRNAKEAELLNRIRVQLALPEPVAAPRAEVKPTPVPTPVSPPPAAVVAAPVVEVDPRQLLEIEPNTELSVDLIRRRYNLLSEKLDPARAAALGAEFAKLAEQKRNQLKAAAEKLLLPFNEPLEKPSVPAPSDIRHNPDLDDAFGM